MPAEVGFYPGVAQMLTVRSLALGSSLALGIACAPLLSGTAEAKSHISVDLGFVFGAPVYAVPSYPAAPVFYAPAPVYVPPPPTYYYPPAVVVPPQVYYAPPPPYADPQAIYWRQRYEEEDD